jgi:hypothetical protein
MIGKAVVVAISAMALMGCGSSSGTSGTGANSGGAPGTGGTTTSTGGAGGSAGTAAGGIPGSGGRTNQGGNTASGGSQSGGAAGRGGAGGGPLGSGGASGSTGGRGGAVSDAAASNDTAVDSAQCPICTTIRCAYGSPVDDNGCTVCVCNPAPDGAIDVTTDGFCALPEGCAGTDAGPGTETGGSRDLNSADAIRCGNAICRPGDYCCNPLTDTCVPPGWGCGF